MTQIFARISSGALSISPNPLDSVSPMLYLIPLDQQVPNLLGLKLVVVLGVMNIDTESPVTISSVPSFTKIHCMLFLNE